MNLVTPGLVYRDEDHSYTLNGEPISGVTSILKPLPKPSLVQWAANLSAGHFRDALKEHLLHGFFNELKPADIDKIYEEARRAHTKRKDKSADTGREIHKWYELYCKTGTIGDLPKTLSQKQADQIIAWRKENGVVTVANEVAMASIKYKYGMTFDELAYVRKVLTVVDLKTTSGTSFEQYLQTAAYQQGVEEISGEKVGQRIILGIPQNSEIFEPVKIASSFEDDFGAFLDTYKIYRMIQHYEGLGFGWRRWR